MQELRKIAVTEAIGRAGRHVDEVLKTRGHSVVAMSCSGGVSFLFGRHSVRGILDQNPRSPPSLSPEKRSKRPP